MFSIEDLSNFLSSTEKPCESPDIVFDVVTKPTLFNRFIEVDTTDSDDVTEEKAEDSPQISQVKEKNNIPSVLSDVFNSEYFMYCDRMKSNNFLSSILSIVCNNYAYLDKADKAHFIERIYQKLAQELDSNHSKFGYTGKRFFRKTTMQQNLTNDKFDIDKEVESVIKKYIADYFGINIYILCRDNDDFEAMRIHCKAEHDDRMPTIVLYKGEQYSSIMRRDFESVFRYSRDSEIIDMIKSKIPKLKKIRIKK